MRTLSRWQDKFGEWRKNRRRVIRNTLTHDTLRLLVTTAWNDGSESSLCVNWRDVTDVSAYKRDLLTTDLICFAISTAEQAIEIHEEMQGWQALIEALPTYLPGMPEQTQWFNTVALPPFATNVTKLFSR